MLDKVLDSIARSASPTGPMLLAPGDHRRSTMKTKERQPSQGNRPITNRPKPSRRYVVRHSMFLVASLVLLVALVIVFLNQFGVISFLHTETTSSLPMVTAEGVLEDAQSNQPLAHVS